HATETVESLRKIAARRGARRGFLKDGQRELVGLFRLRVFSQHVKRAPLQIECAGIALMLGAESRLCSRFELARLRESCVVIAGLEKIVVAFYERFEVGLAERRSASHCP